MCKISFFVITVLSELKDHRIRQSNKKNSKSNAPTASACSVEQFILIFVCRSFPLISEWSLINYSLILFFFRLFVQFLFPLNGIKRLWKFWLDFTTFVLWINLVYAPVDKQNYRERYCIQKIRVFRIICAWVDRPTWCSFCFGNYILEKYRLEPWFLNRMRYDSRNIS